MGYKLNIRGASDWQNLLKDLYIEVDNTNWTSTTLSGFLNEVQTALDGKKSRNVVKTALNYSTSSFDVVLVDTTAPVTITLPTSPSQGDEVYITDTVGNAHNSNITVNRNNHNINGIADNLVIDVALGSAKLIYDNVTNGWHLDAGGSYFGGDISSLNDPFLTLNSDFTEGTPTENGGLILKRGDEGDAIVRWNESLGQWELTDDGTTYHKILTTADVSNHGSLDGLDADDHTQYVHNTTARTISAKHTFNPSTVDAPFIIGSNANKQLVEGLNSQYANGILFTSNSTTTEPTEVSAGDIWFEYE